MCSTMTIDDILRLEPDVLMKLSRSELAKVVSQASSAGNKRIKRLGLKGMPTPAVQAIERTGGKFSVKGKNLNQLRAEFYRVSGFLKARTSTIKGAKKVQKEVETRIGGKLKPAEMVNFWRAYRKVDELEPNFLRLYGSTQMQQFLRNEVVDSGKDVDEIVISGIEEIDRQYDEREDEVDEMGEFFEI